MQKPLLTFCFFTLANLLLSPIWGAPRVVILGFDGADPKLVEQYLEEGLLPNLARLRAQGSYHRLATTNPPQTPVSWSAFSTGLNPGRTEIFDFLKRIDGTYVPEFAMGAEVKKRFWWGPMNGLAAAAAVAVSTLLLGLVLARIWSRNWRMIIVATLLVATTASWGANLLANKMLPHMVPDARNNRKGITLWEWASRHGVTTKVLHVPNTFPADQTEGGNMLSGLGVPDIRGRIGSPSYYTSNVEERANLRENQFSIEFIELPENTNSIQTHIVGPYNKAFFDYVVDEALVGVSGSEARQRKREKIQDQLESRGIKRRIDLPMTLAVAGDQVTIRVSDQEQTLSPGDWSQWFTLKFPVNWMVDHLDGVKGIARFKLLSVRPHLRLYLSPVNFHPAFEPIPFSSPKGFAGSLAHEIGLFKTLGWPIDTWTPSAGLGDDELFLEDLEFTVQKQEEMMKRFLGAGETDLYIQVFDFTDRIGHLWWRLLDKGHPLHDPVEAARYEGEMAKAYQRMDAIVGEAQGLLPPETLLLVCSDHGFASFRRGINYNTWLVREGWMVLKEGPGGTRSLEDLFDLGETGEFFKYVDWSRTRAYAMGLGSIYINLAGREPRGSVAPGSEYDEVRAGIIKGLEAFVDPQTGEHPVLKVYRREEMYNGFDPGLVPDLRAANREHYRVGWQTALGEVPPHTVEDNLRVWSGDHCSVDPSLVPGILFSNRKLIREDPGILDIFPSVLEVLDLPPVEGIDGQSFF